MPLHHCWITSQQSKTPSCKLFYEALVLGNEIVNGEAQIALIQKIVAIKEFTKDPVLRRRRPRGVGGKSSQLLINIIDIPGPPLSAAGKPPARPCAATQRKPATRRIFISKFLPTDSGISSLFDPFILQVLFVPQRCKIKGFVSRLLAKLPCHGGSDQEEISVLQEGCYFFFNITIH